MNRILALAACVAATASSACSTKESAPGAQPARDAAAPPAPDDDPKDASGMFALATLGENPERTVIEVHRIADGVIEKVSSTDIPGEVLGDPMMAWPAGGALVVGGNPSGAKRWTYGTIVDGRYASAATGKHRGALSGMDDKKLIVTTSGEVWMEQCVAWGTDNPEEEGCEKRVHHRIVPGKGTAAKRPEGAPLPAGVAAPADITLAVRNVGTDDEHGYVIDCTIGGQRITLLEHEHVYEMPTVHWLSANPPIAFASLMYPGLGERDEEEETPVWQLLRGCALASAEDSNIMIGPDGLWALETYVPLLDGLVRHDIHWRGVELGSIEGVAVVFHGGPPT